MDNTEREQAIHIVMLGEQKLLGITRTISTKTTGRGVEEREGDEAVPPRAP